jgi:hypothetical protein
MRQAGIASADLLQAAADLDFADPAVIAIAMHRSERHERRRKLERLVSAINER